MKLASPQMMKNLTSIKKVKFKLLLDDSCKTLEGIKSKEDIDIEFKRKLFKYVRQIYRDFQTK
ncbi:MAG: hypothetical protein U5K55_02100 [Aliarcobacter sp.]|nr:hypothetical protein [Aliarcobacter sp.]